MSNPEFYVHTNDAENEEVPVIIPLEGSSPVTPAPREDVRPSEDVRIGDENEGELK